MKEGIYVPDTYYVSADGKEFHGKFAELTKETEFEGLDKTFAFSIIMLGSVKYRFFNGGKWKSSFGGNWITPPFAQKYVIEGDQVTLYDTSGSVSTKLTIGEEDTLSASVNKDGIIFSLTYVLDEEE